MFPKLKAVVEIENYSKTEFDAWEILPTEGLNFIDLVEKFKTDFDI
jgi:hypothetical protein